MFVKIPLYIFLYRFFIINVLSFEVFLLILEVQCIYCLDVCHVILCSNHLSYMNLLYLVADLLRFPC
jgi:hypothetical protein